MSKYNPVYNTIWTSNRFLNLGLKTKLIFLYLLTNERITQTGIYTITLKNIVCDTNLTLKEVKRCIEELETFNLIKFWADDNLIFILDNFKFARNTIKNSVILHKTIQGQKSLYHNEKVWQIFENKYHAELEVINKALINQQSYNNINNSHNRINKEGI